MNPKPAGHQQQHMKDILDQLIHIMLQKGEIFDSDFDNLGFMKEQSKDGLIVSQRRTCILTNTALIQREVDKANEKKDIAAATAAKRALTKEKAAAKKATKVAGSIQNALPLVIAVPHTDLIHPAPVPPLPVPIPDLDQHPAVIPKPTRKRKLATVASQIDDIATMKLLCYCRLPYNEQDGLGNMIQCEFAGNCRFAEWYHCIHVNLARNFTTDDPWTCISCLMNIEK